MKGVTSSLNYAGSFIPWRVDRYSVYLRYLYQRIHTDTCEACVTPSLNYAGSFIPLRVDRLSVYLRY